MKKKRFTIKELKVKSFVTKISETEQKTTKGGDVVYRLLPNFDIWTVEKSQFANPSKIFTGQQRLSSSGRTGSRIGD